uniref:Shisa N-terminal domain-containing protein n=1 Tax=Pyxicephalus adspersus TaxID=30357 RepID=A0AAV3A5K0_PYXAD|nr:TPA: hypothetical protein GDO54_016976 [Pyxicephalus adspersus]
MDQIIKLFAFIGLMCITNVVADDCAPYVGEDFQPHRGQTCVLSFCAGSCTNRYCSIIPGTMLDQSQPLCIMTNLYFVVGIGILLAIGIVAGVISCFFKSLCLYCSLFQRQPRSAHSTNVAVTNIVPQQPLITMPAAAGYQHVPNHAMYAGQPDKAHPPPYPSMAPAYSS